MVCSLRSFLLQVLADELLDQDFSFQTYPTYDRNTTVNLNVGYFSAIARPCTAGGGTDLAPPPGPPQHDPSDPRHRCLELGHPRDRATALSRAKGPGGHSSISTIAGYVGGFVLALNLGKVPPAIGLAAVDVGEPVDPGQLYAGKRLPVPA